MQMGCLSFKTYHSTFQQYMVDPLHSFIFHLRARGFLHHPHYFLEKFENHIFIKSKVVINSLIHTV